MPYLYFRHYGDYRGPDAQQQIEADEELIDEAALRLSVEDEQQHDGSKRCNVAEDCHCQQCYRGQNNVNIFQKNT